MADDSFALTHPVPVGGRASHDHYPTPRWCTKALIRHCYQQHEWWWLHSGVERALDPACGEGAILDVLKEHRVTTFGYELHADRAEAARQRGHQIGVGDALARDWIDADLCVMNPPYALAEAFVRKALDWQRTSPRKPPVFALLRLSWLEPTSSRGDLLRSHPPDVLILPRRPAFDGRGTDSTTSAWFAWPSDGRLIWLPEVAP